RDATLDLPAEDDLRDRLAVLTSNLFENRVREHVVPAFGERRPCLDLDAVLAQERLCFDLLLERVHLDLVHRRHDLVVDDQIHDAVRLVIADADGTDAAIAKHSLHRTPGAVNVTERLMDQVEVEIVEPEALQGPLERGLRALLALVLDPQLGGDEDLLARDAAGPDRLADRFLVAIGRSRIYQPVTDRQRVRNAPLALLRVGNLEHTEPEDRHL